MLKNRENLLFFLQIIPLCFSIGSFVFIIFGLIGYIEERSNEKIYVSTNCYLDGTITINEKCKDDICWWPISLNLCPSTYRLCLKSIYVITYGNNQKGFTDIQPLSYENICYYDKTKSGVVRWKKPQSKEYLNELIIAILIFLISIISWINLIYFKKLNKLGYRILPL